MLLFTAFLINLICSLHSLLCLLHLSPYPFNFLFVRLTVQIYFFCMVLAATHHFSHVFLLFLSVTSSFDFLNLFIYFNLLYYFIPSLRLSLKGEILMSLTVNLLFLKFQFFIFRPRGFKFCKFISLCCLRIKLFENCLSGLKDLLAYFHLYLN